MSLGSVIEPGNVRIDGGSEVTRQGLPGAFILRAGRPVVAARRPVLVWNLCHVPKLDPFQPRVEGASQRSLASVEAPDQSTFQQLLEVAEHHLPELG